MKKIGTKTLETDRLILRKFKKEDAEFIYNNWASDNEVTKYLMWQAHKSISDSKEYIDFVMEGYKNNSFDWIIELKELGQPIGSIGVVNINEKVESVHIGYCIGRKWWHKGITSEAFKEVIKFLFEEAGVNRIESRHDPRNINSGLVMKKCGLSYEGTLRMCDYNNQGICDASYYALLRKDYSNC